MPEFNQKNQLCLEPSQVSSKRKKIMLFDLEITGHHAGYIRHLIYFWGENNLPGTLDVVVSPQFIKQHTDVIDLATKYSQRQVNIVSVTPAEEAGLFPRSSYFRKKIHFFQVWELCRNYAQSLETTHCLLMYFDTFQVPIAFRRKFPCPFSAIYFRPTFHYHNFQHYQSTRKDKLETLQLSLALHHPQLQTLLCLDPFAVKYFDQFKSRVKPVYLPDPVQIYSDSTTTAEKLRENLGIDANRKVFLLFGSLDERKGLHQLLEAVGLIQSHLCQQMCLLLVGPIDTSIKSQVENQLSQISQSLPIQIITHNQFIADHKIQTYFQLADVILAPYQQHVGMSAILVRSAAAQKPVIASDYGLMGEITRRYELGITVDSTAPTAIAQGLTQFLMESPEKFGDAPKATALGNRTKMKLFAEQNSADKFAKVIFDSLHVV